MGFAAESGFEGLAHTLPTQAHPLLESCQGLAHEELSSPHTVSAVERCHPSSLDICKHTWKFPRPQGAAYLF